MEKDDRMDTDPAPGGSSATPPDAGQKGPTPGPSKLVKASPKRHKIKDGGVTFYVLGDSHLRDQHGFPGSYAFSRAAGTIDRRLSAINRIVGEGSDQPEPERGYTLTEAYLAKVLGLVEMNSGKAVVYFLSVGTNDLREVKKATVDDRKVKIDDLMTRFGKLMTKVDETPGAALFVLEPIPCNRGIQKDRDQLDQLLESEVQKHEGPLRHPDAPTEAVPPPWSERSSSLAGSLVRRPPSQQDRSQAHRASPQLHDKSVWLRGLLRRSCSS